MIKDKVLNLSPKLVFLMSTLGVAFNSGLSLAKTSGPRIHNFADEFHQALVESKEQTDLEKITGDSDIVAKFRHQRASGSHNSQKLLTESYIMPSFLRGNERMSIDQYVFVLLSSYL